MAEIVNLRLARKRRRRDDREKEAAANRAAHGVPKAERQRLEAEARSAARSLDGHRRDGDRDEG